MINMGTTILSNIYLIRRSVKSAYKSGFRYLISIAIVGIIYFECVFVQQYLQKFIHIMEQEIMSGDLKSAQISLDGNKLLIMQFSLGRDIFSFLILVISIYLLLDFRNKLSIIKMIDKENIETKIYLGVHPKHVLKELLLKTFFIYMSGLILACVICILININLVASLNSILPYDVQKGDRNSIFLSMFLSILVISIIIAIYSMLIKYTSIRRFKRNFSLY